MDINELKVQVNAVVGKRLQAQSATTERTDSYQEWLVANQVLLDKEANAKVLCQEAEAKLREMTVQVYTDTGDKAILPGIGIRVMTRLNYDSQTAFEWAIEHKLALKLDGTAFEKIAKTSNLPFVIQAEEPQATISYNLQELKEGE